MPQLGGTTYAGKGSDERDILSQEVPGRFDNWLINKKKIRANGNSLFRHTGIICRVINAGRENVAVGGANALI